MPVEKSRHLRQDSVRHMGIRSTDIKIHSYRLHVIFCADFTYSDSDCRTYVL